MVVYSYCYIGVLELVFVGDIIFVSENVKFVDIYVCWVLMLVWGMS